VSAIVRGRRSSCLSSTPARAITTMRVDERPAWLRLSPVGGPWSRRRART
jgi:hypothetical protein